jgi:hypothetical protein
LQSALIFQHKRRESKNPFYLIFLLGIKTSLVQGCNKEEHKFLNFIFRQRGEEK